MTAALLVFLSLCLRAAALRPGEECASQYGWKGACRASWDCLALSDLVSLGYQLELCGSEGPTVCCPHSSPTQLHNHLPTPPKSSYLLNHPSSTYGVNHLSPTHGFNPFSAAYDVNKLSPTHGVNQYSPLYSKPFYSSFNRLPNKKLKKKRFQSAYLKTYIQDEDDNTIVRVTPLRTPLKRRKRKPFPSPSRCLASFPYLPKCDPNPCSEMEMGNAFTYYSTLKNTMKEVSYPTDLTVQDDRFSFNYEKPQKESLSALKCQEYTALAWENLPEFSPSNRVFPTSQELCPGNNKASTVQAAELPFMVGLGYEGEAEDIVWGCSGTLISNEYVLTAAHCLHPPLGRPKIIRLGMSHLNSRDQGLGVGVSEVIIHPMYNPGDRTANIALIRLAQAPPLGMKIRPACLQYNGTGTLVTPYWVKDPTVMMELKTEGDDFVLITDPEALVMRKSMSVEMNKHNCNISTLDENVICSETVSTSTCQSLSEGGEPLILKDKQNPCLQAVIGVAIDKACSPVNPTLYTRIQPYISWIENIIWSEI